jgi:hypothetical protein
MFAQVPFSALLLSAPPLFSANFKCARRSQKSSAFQTEMCSAWGTGFAIRAWLSGCAFRERNSTSVMAGVFPAHDALME